ncbi:uncharacterized protein LOC102802004 [Saccoglossus kowalevskii]|uniref:Uncharacterized protein LOC102802004 n=1 Tax=Saccoglossus kowalevskii TaxID=10224 RepID=A0ABM0M1A4_SACKO|nr:PREDICTED: uncharacterized protein LOC102802004 [Saccoglossus kowalevskii]
MYSICDLGTDCADCGDRGSIQPTTPTTNNNYCTDTCYYNNDGECDDGGAGSIYSLCDLGTDCADCGDRTLTVCTNECYWSYDGECDDGGPGFAYNLCVYGSDCEDCGGRAGLSKRSNTPTARKSVLMQKMKKSKLGTNKQRIKNR